MYGWLIPLFTSRFLPVRPRVRRRRRGHDFQANFEEALTPALEGRVDVVVHGGDLFHRPGVPASLGYQGLAPLVRVAESGVPVLLVPGNHERSRIPHVRFGEHPRIHVFDRPRVIDLHLRGGRARFVGFPFERQVRSRFRSLLRRAGWRPDPGSPTLLCMHQCVEGATVGPSDFTFTSGDDVVQAGDLPPGLCAVLSGHIHRHQVLTHGLSGRPLPAPVFYPGSVERTAVAERDEPKGYLVVEIDPRSPETVPRLTFHRLPARPMLVRELDVEGRSGAAVEAALSAIVGAAPPDAVLRIRTHGTAGEEARRVLSARHVRRLAPPAMNLEIRESGAPFRRARRRSGSLQPELGL